MRSLPGLVTARADDPWLRVSSRFRAGFAQYGAPSSPRRAVSPATVPSARRNAKFGARPAGILTRRRRRRADPSAPRRRGWRCRGPAPCRASSRGLEPATTKSVRLDTPPVTFAPSACNVRFASSRDIVSRVPVRTNVFPASGLGACSSGRAGAVSSSDSASTRASTTTSLRASSKNRRMLAATIGPTSGTSTRASSSASRNDARVPK